MDSFLASEITGIRHKLNTKTELKMQHNTFSERIYSVQNM